MQESAIVNKSLYDYLNDMSQQPVTAPGNNKGVQGNNPLKVVTKMLDVAASASKGGVSKPTSTNYGDYNINSNSQYV